MGIMLSTAFQLMVPSILSFVDPRSEPFYLTRAFAVRVSNSHTVVVRHDGTTIPLAAGKAQAGETNL